MMRLTPWLPLAFFALVPSALAEDQLVWQLGKTDGSSGEFKIPYNAWEYGTAPEIAKSPFMDHKTHLFSYEIKGAGEIKSPEMPRGVSTCSERHWMPNDEILSGVKLSWNEAEAGNRKLSLNLVDWSNGNGGEDGIELLLPDGAKKIFNLPYGRAKKGEPLKFEAVFPVKSGSNELTLRIVSMAKHYKFSFDSIALAKTDDAPNLERLLEHSFNAQSNIYTPGQKAEMSLQGFNIPKGDGEVSYSVTDAFDGQVASGKTSLKDSTGKIVLPTERRGYFKVAYAYQGKNHSASYVVIEPVTLEYIDDSRFGCHGLETDGYRLRNWPEFHEMLMYRASMAGARWVRHHSIHWFLREPEKGNFDWTYLDDRFALADKYKMRVLITLGGTPKWASVSKDSKLTCCGTYTYQNYPPKDWKDWADFVSAVVSRYKNQVKWYELWNEPGYSSAFWCNGSAKDFGMILKAGYEAAKKADPDSVILSGAPLNTQSFLEEAVRDNGGKLYFDVMSIHYTGTLDKNCDIFRKWKSALEKLGGGSLPFVNTEEMGWRDKKTSPMEFASNVLKVHIHEAALGFLKTFEFDLFQNNSIHSASSFDVNGNPLPQYAAYRTMTHRLERAKYVADLSTAECEAYLFDRQGTAVLAVWSKKEGMASFTLGTKMAKLVDLMDNETALQPVNGVVKLKTSFLPVFIEGGDLGLLKSFSAVLALLPQEISLKPGEKAERTLNLPSTVSALKLVLPDSWSGKADNAKLSLAVPANAPEGTYDASLSFLLEGGNYSVPFLLNVSKGSVGANLIVNGDFAKESFCWFLPKEKEKWEFLKDAGRDGKPALKTTGTAFFGCAGGVKVRAGERYAVVAEAKGEGTFGGVYALVNKEGKTIYPEKPHIDCLAGSGLGPEWRKFTDVISITQPEAERLSFAVLANYGDKSDRKEAVFNSFSLVKLSDKFTLSKVSNQGVCVKTDDIASLDWSKVKPMLAESQENVLVASPLKWTGKDDLSASCRLAMDSENLHLRFSVKDDKAVFPKDKAQVESGWNQDSIQIAFDPTLEGKDRTELLIARDSAGKTYVYKLINFWTPELPSDITMRGWLQTAEVSVKLVPGGMEYQVKIPLKELYPLTKNSQEFGFSWLVNDNDGAGRKYLEWSSGIGAAKDSSLFGIVRCEKAE